MKFLHIIFLLLLLEKYLQQEECQPPTVGVDTPSGDTVCQCFGDFKPDDNDNQSCVCNDPNANPVDNSFQCTCTGQYVKVQDSEPTQCRCNPDLFTQNEDSTCTCIIPLTTYNQDQNACLCNEGLKFNENMTNCICENDDQNLVDGECVFTMVVDCEPPKENVDGMCQCMQGFKDENNDGECECELVGGMISGDKMSCACAEDLQPDGENMTCVCKDRLKIPNDERSMCVCRPGLVVDGESCGCEMEGQVPDMNGVCIDNPCAPPREFVDGVCQCLPDFDENEETMECECRLVNSMPNEEMTMCDCIDPLVMKDDLCLCEQNNHTFQDGMCFCGGEFEDDEDGECVCRFGEDTIIEFTPEGVPSCNCKFGFALDAQTEMCTCNFERENGDCVCPNDQQDINQEGTECTCKDGSVVDGDGCRCEMTNFVPNNEGICECFGQFELKQDGTCGCVLVDSVLNGETGICECPSGKQLNEAKDGCIDEHGSILLFSSTLFILILSVII